MTITCYGGLKVLQCHGPWLHMGLGSHPGLGASLGLVAQDEVFYFEKMEVNDFRNDVLLAEACRSDVDKLCRHVEPGALPEMLPDQPIMTQCLTPHFELVAELATVERVCQHTL